MDCLKDFLNVGNRVCSFYFKNCSCYITYNYLGKSIINNTKSNQFDNYLVDGEISARKNVNSLYATKSVTAFVMTVNKLYAKHKYNVHDMKVTSF